MTTETAAPPAAAPARETLLTRFFILERTTLRAQPELSDPPTEDELGALAAHQEEVVAWRPLGEKLARDRDHALRLFLSDPPREIDGVYVAVSENGWKPRDVTIKHTPKVTIGEATG